MHTSPYCAPPDEIETIWQWWQRGLISDAEMARLQNDAMPLRCACGGAVMDMATMLCAVCFLAHHLPPTTNDNREAAL
jgi:hypothetical protein